MLRANDRCSVCMFHAWTHVVVGCLYQSAGHMVTLQPYMACSAFCCSLMKASYLFFMFSACLWPYVQLWQIGRLPQLMCPCPCFKCLQIACCSGSHRRLLTSMLPKTFYSSVLAQIRNGSSLTAMTALDSCWRLHSHMMCVRNQFQEGLRSNCH